MSKQPKDDRARKSGGRPQAARTNKAGGGDTFRHKSKHVETKLSDATLCPDCKAVYADGRWHWANVPDPSGAAREVCPACKRIREHLPAGEVRISGDFAREHRAEILGRIRHLEEKEKAEHPLNRLMEVRELPDALVVTTTDIHLAHAIGKALHDSFKGKLDAPWVEEGDLMRVRWER
jgi:hypothetical protein